MKKFFKLFFLLLFLTSCNEETATEEENEKFFGIVYQTKASRIIGRDRWFITEGEQRYKFEQEEDESGKFTATFSEFKEVQLLTDFCSGGFSGSYAYTDSIDSEPNTSDGGYNPLDPYGDAESPSETIITDPNGVELEIVYSYLFELIVSERSLSDGCRRLENTYKIRAVRFKSGDVVLTDYSKELEYYLIPELISE